MSLPVITAIVLIVLTSLGFYLGRSRSLSRTGGSTRELHSLPNYYGYFVAWTIALPALIVFAAWMMFSPELVRIAVMNGVDPAALSGMSDDRKALLFSDIVSVARGDAASEETAEILKGAERYNQYTAISDWLMLAFTGGLGIVALLWASGRVSPAFRARNSVEGIILSLLIVCSLLAILTTVGIVFSLVFESLRFFEKVPFTDFIFGLQWSPQTALRAEQFGQSGAFGAVPVFTGTFLIMLVAMAVAAPIGLLTAVYLSEYASRGFRTVVKPIVEILAGIPTVVYGFFAFLTVAPFIRNTISNIGMWVTGAEHSGMLAGTMWDVPTQSAIAAGAVMGIMIIPFVSSLSDDVINAVPQSLRDGSYAMGATKSETMVKVIFPAALPGIVGAILLAVSRAIGETMIVVMAAGRAANLTGNPFEAVTTVTVQIVSLLTGDQEFDSSKTLSAFALGLVLFFITLALNIVALRIVQKYREKYD